MQNSQCEESVHTRLLDSAAVLFLENGFHKTSIRQIASHAETTSGMVSYYYTDKLGLFKAMIEREYGKLWEIIKNNIPEDGTPDYATTLSHFMCFYRENPLVARLIIVSWLAADKPGLGVVSDIYRYERKSVADWFDREKALGNIQAHVDSEIIKLSLAAYSLFPFFAKELLETAYGTEFSDDFIASYTTLCSKFLYKGIDKQFKPKDDAFASLNNEVTPREQIESEKSVDSNLLTQAGKLFLQSDFSQVSVREIVEAADTSVAMINYYFKSKFGLFECVLDNEYAKLSECFHTLNQSSSHSLYHVFTMLIQRYQKEPELAEFFVKAALFDKQVVLKKLVRRVQEDKVFIEQWLDREGMSSNKKELSCILHLAIFSLATMPILIKRVLVSIEGQEKYYEFLEKYANFQIGVIEECLRDIKNSSRS